MPPPGWYPPGPRKKRGIGLKVFNVLGILILICSFLLNGLIIGGAILVAGSMEDMKFVRSTVRQGEADQVVAVYSIHGIIDGRQAGRFRQFCREVQADGNIKAVVLRVDSPGGGVSASDQMHAMVQTLCDKGKRVVVSMGGVAASGGYYVSAPADEIVAEETTITGSIGVLAMWVVFDGTLDKIGAESMVLRSTHARGWKDDISPLRKPDARQRKRLQKLLDQMQERFEDVIRKGRGDKLPVAVRQQTPMLPIEGDVTIKQAGEAVKVTSEPPDPFNGKVFLAAEAKALGLVDHIGYLDKALERAADLANLSNPHVVEFAPRRGVLAQLMDQRRPDTAVKLGRELLDDLQTPRIMMLWKAE
jgi:protease-4